MIDRHNRPITEGLYLDDMYRTYKIQADPRNPKRFQALVSSDFSAGYAPLNQKTAKRLSRIPNCKLRKRLNELMDFLSEN